MNEANTTRDKIVHAASGLFASKGFKGTSIRELANTAEVNLAAINYHFENKENLYCKVFERHYKQLAADIKDIGVKETSVEEFTWATYQYFLSNGAALLNTFMMFMSEDVTIPPTFCGEDSDSFGPPGQEVLLEKINSELENNDVPLLGKQWAMRMIFCEIVHMAISMQSPMLKNNMDQFSFLNIDYKEKSIKNLVRAIMSHLRNAPSEWA